MTVQTSSSFVPKLNLLIGGTWRPAEGDCTVEVRNPATEELVAVAASAQKADLEAAAQAAAEGFKVWRATPPLQRGQVLRKAAAGLRQRAPEIAIRLTLENGKTLKEADAEVNWACDYLEWYAEEARRTYGRVIPPRMAGVRQFVVREPVGPVLALSPWNWPLVTATRKVAPALAAGCSVILKPAEEAPSAPAQLARELIAAGLPPSAINVVQGVPANISEYLIAHPVIRKVSFTGSVSVGKLLAGQAAKYLKRITLELGGHAPVIICGDADLESAVKKILPIKFRTSGQVCSCPSRFFVHRSVRQEFVRLMAKACSSLKAGDGRLADSDMGPLISERRLKAIQNLVSDATGRGAKIRAGGQRVGNRGFFFAPTLLDEVTDDALIMNEEPFGPIVAVTEFTETDEVIRRANALPLGLAAYVFTKSLSNSRRISEDLECGMVGVNTLTVSMAEAPFGGVKDSGYGYEGGIEGISAYLVDKFVAESD
jgi:succinate-semialdehyde dehydrogenase/glutarate-semialdehyde dehydrogenase